MDYDEDKLKKYFEEARKNGLEDVARKDIELQTILQKELQSMLLEKTNEFLDKHQTIFQQSDLANNKDAKELHNKLMSSTICSAGLNLLNQGVDNLDNNTLKQVIQDVKEDVAKWEQKYSTNSSEKE